MSSIRWTDEQEKAIATRGGNLLVSAAAGSGKTAVLVERIVRRLLDEKEPVDVDRLLVVTFTDAAAAEMRQRITARLTRALQEQPGSARVQRQLFLAPRASIGTLHSFCAEVVRRHFYLLGLDPGFRVMDENEASLLRLEVLSDVLEECYEEHRDAPPEAPFLYLARALADRHGGDRELPELILRLYAFARSLPRPRAWLNRTAAVLAEAPARTWEEQPWFGEWREWLRLELEGWRDALAEAARLAAGASGPKAYGPVLAEDLARVQAWLEMAEGGSAGFFDLKKALEEGREWGDLPRTARGEAAEEVKKRVRQLRGRVKERLGGLLAEYFARSPEELALDLARMAPQMQALVEATLRFDRAYRQAKRERAVADFADLEHDALAILAANGEGSPWGEEAPGDPAAPLLPSPVAKEYRNFFAEVLVDEYQDINGVQEALLELVSRGDNRFLVGDVKQSIYRFRLADPQVFLSRYRAYADLDFDPASGPAPGRRAVLSANFRSRREILETVNYVFSRLMTSRAAELDYDERARLNCRAGYPECPAGNAGGPVEIHLLDYAPPETLLSGGLPGGQNGEETPAAAFSGEVNGGGEPPAGPEPPEPPAFIPGAGRPGPEPEEPEELDLVRLEARWAAERVHRLVTEEKFLVYQQDKKEYRPVTWRDVVVLMRSLKGRAGVFVEEFRRLGVPVYADGSGGYFAAPEVETVLAALQVIDNPRRDIPLAAVLRSPLAGLNAARLAEIRLACPEGDFYTAVRRAAQGPPGVAPELARVLSRFLERLEGWRELARRLPPAELLTELYRQTGYYDLVGALPGGAVRQANLRALVDRARRFEGTIYRGLFRFLRFIEQLREEGGDLDAARSLGENEDVVRIMSVHRAKGLEFPVVVVAGLGRRFNLQDLSRSFLLHRQLGCGPVVTDLERGVRYPTVLHRVIKERLRREALAEEMRLLYVALTRARERLILAAAVRQLDRRVEQWRSRAAAAPPEGPLSVSLLTGAGSFLDWLGPALWSHPDLAGLSAGEEVAAAGNEFLRVHLWPATALERLGSAAAGKEEGRDSLPARQLADLLPLPAAWLQEKEKQEREAGRAEGAAEMPGDEELRRRLFWTYPHRELAALPSKVTVTEWRHRQEELAEQSGEEMPAAGWREDVFQESELPPGLDLPAFYAGEHPGGTERGRAVHLVMQTLELASPPDEAAVRRHLASLVEREILRPEERRLVRPAEIVRFWRGELGRRVLAAAKNGRLWREVPFTLGLPVPELYPETAGRVPPGETVLLQGTIDCLLVEEDGLVIIDYKTDRLTEDELPAAADRYRPQLALYARAAQQILSRPVLEKYLYFFALDRAVAV
ncbi:MAG: UvrD-helicase domain-containing protein [Armatimonadetes bacterium]|nr:UvrD-helicase domain-containing protein [Armatimonadota bacterium]